MMVTVTLSTSQSTDLISYHLSSCVSWPRNHETTATVTRTAGKSFKARVGKAKGSRVLRGGGVATLRLAYVPKDYRDCSHDKHK